MKVEIEFPEQNAGDAHLWISATGQWLTVYDKLTSAGVQVNVLSPADVHTLKNTRREAAHGGYDTPTVG
jgi:hypothetical protein